MPYESISQNLNEIDPKSIKSIFLPSPSEQVSLVDRQTDRGEGGAGILLDRQTDRQTEEEEEQGYCWTDRQTEEEEEQGTTGSMWMEAQIETMTDR